MSSASTLPPDFVNVILNAHQMIVETVDEDPPAPGHYAETVGKVELAVARIDERVYGRESFSSLPEKAAILIKELNDLHCFPDGNKRTSLVAMAYYLFWNLWPFTNTTSEEEMVRRIADRAPGKEVPFHEIVAWIRSNTQPVDLQSIASSARFSRYPRIDFDVRVERTEVGGKDQIAIRADAKNPSTGRTLTRKPFLQRIMRFARNQPPEELKQNLEIEVVPPADRSTEARQRAKMRRKQINKRKRRARRR